MSEWATEQENSILARENAHYMLEKKQAELKIISNLWFPEYDRLYTCVLHVDCVKVKVLVA